MILRRSLAAAAIAIFALTASGQNNAHLASVLAQMDAASARFHDAEAAFTQQTYEAVVHDTTSQNGAIYFERKGSSTEMGAYLMEPDGKTREHVLQYNNGSLQVFDPHVNQVQIFSANGDNAQYDTFLTLGFGGSGKALAAAWNIQDLGSETLSDGSQSVVVEKLDLVSKQAAVRNNFSHVMLWIDPARAVSLKQAFFTPAGDSRTTVYRQIRINTKIDRGPFAIPHDKSISVIRH